jgi:hypothetical protein
MRWFYTPEDPEDQDIKDPCINDSVGLHKWFYTNSKAMLVSVYASYVEGKVCLVIEANVGKDRQETEMQMLSDDEPVFWTISSLPPQIQHEASMALTRAFSTLMKNRPELVDVTIVQCVDLRGESQVFPIDYDRQNLYGLL